MTELKVRVEFKNMEGLMPRKPKDNITKLKVKKNTKTKSAKKAEGVKNDGVREVDIKENIGSEGDFYRRLPDYLFKPVPFVANEKGEIKLADAHVYLFELLRHAVFIRPAKITDPVKQGNPNSDTEIMIKQADLLIRLLEKIEHYRAKDNVKEKMPTDAA